MLVIFPLSTITLWSTDITMENHHIWWVNQRTKLLWLQHRTVAFPEGNSDKTTLGCHQATPCPCPWVLRPLAPSFRSSQALVVVAAAHPADAGDKMVGSDQQTWGKYGKSRTYVILSRSFSIYIITHLYLYHANGMPQHESKLKRFNGVSPSMVANGQASGYPVAIGMVPKWNLERMGHFFSESEYFYKKIIQQQSTTPAFTSNFPSDLKWRFPES